VVVDDAAGLVWIVNLGCLELHPHPVNAGDLDHPNELRIDLDNPGRSDPGCGRRHRMRSVRSKPATGDEKGL
jgi:hypothetical protein